MNEKIYDFPVTNKFEAREVTEMNFQIEPGGPAYVELNHFRYKDSFKGIYYSLNIDAESGNLETLTNSYVKIIFSGHRGTGKTTELKRLHKDINDCDRYFSVLVELEKEFDGATFRPEYLFVALIAMLIARVHEENISFKSSVLDDIAKEWTNNREMKDEISDIAKMEVSSEANIGVKLFSFFGMQSGFKALLGGETKTAEVITQQIRKEPFQLISRFNEVLSDLRKALKKSNCGKDVLFVVDGFEKLGLSADAYMQIFIKDAHIIKAISANAIITTPINVWYEVRNNPAQNFSKTYTLPMVDLSQKGAKETFKQIITKRIKQETFFPGEEALNLIVEYSGGSPRQVLQIVNNALTAGMGSPISVDLVKEVLYDMGRIKFERLTSKHIEKLDSGNYNDADAETVDLQFDLALLKYNGKKGVNPLITYYREHKEH